MTSKKESGAATKTLFLPHTRNLNSITWDQRPPQSSLGYLDDARVLAKL
jgi:hypothetical protein